MNIKVGTRFILNSENGMTYEYEVINVNDFREPSMRYAADVMIVETGESLPDEVFFGDDWLNNFSSQIEFIVER